MNAIFLSHDSVIEVNGNARLCLRCGAGSALRMLARLDYRLFVLCHARVPLRARDLGTHAHAGADRLGDLLFREHLELSGYYCSTAHDADADGDGGGGGGGGGGNGGGGDSARGKQASRSGDETVAAAGMLLRAAREHGVALATSWIIGSTLGAVEAGNRAGCRSVLIDDGHEGSWRLGSHRVPSGIAPDLYAAAVLIAHAPPMFAQMGKEAHPAP